MRQYAGVASWIATVGLIDDSDIPNAANFDLVGQNLADRTMYLYTLTNQMINGVTGGTYAPSAPITVAGSGLRCPTGTQWELDGVLYCDGTGTFHPTITLDGANASLRLQGGGFVDVRSGGAIQVSGLLSINAGSTTTVAATIEWLSGGIATFDAGAHLHMIAASQLQLDRGDAIRIGDGTDPLYVTTRNRTIAQPMDFAELVPNTYFAHVIDRVVDTASGGVGWYRLTKLVNGATLDRATVRVTYTAHGAPGTVATMSLVRTDITTGTQTSLISRPINTTSGASQNADLVPTVVETIDDTKFIYSVQMQPESGIGAGQITWYPPAVQCGTIQYARSI